MGATANNRQVSPSTGEYTTSNLIAKGGEFLSPSSIADGSETYVGGMAYYYGVGDAGLDVNNYTTTYTDKIYIARFDGENRVLECYHTLDGGANYITTGCIRSIAQSHVRRGGNEPFKLLRGVKRACFESR